MPTAITGRPKATAQGIKCGHCSSREWTIYHATVAAVRECSQSGLGVARPEAPAPAAPAPAASSPATAPAQVIKPALLDGTYTIERPDGTHRTFEIRLADEGDLAGKIIISYLSGPDNTKDFTGFGFVFGSMVRVWKRFRDQENSQLRADLAQFMADPEAALKEARCELCHRKLSRPDSINRRRGPECAKKP